VSRLVELSASDCKRLCVDRLCKALCLELILRKVDLVCCAQITCPVQSWPCGSVPVRRLKETNKEEEELVDVAPHWGEPHISCVDVLCVVMFMLFICLST
jgi:hypothetical protein